MGYSYTEKEMAHYDAMNKKFDILMEEYKKGKSFGGYYLLLIHGGKFPTWSVTGDYRFWEKEKVSVWDFKSLKDAKNFIRERNNGRLELRED